MKTIWRQIKEQLAVDCYNEAVDSELRCPEEPHKAFKSYHIAALLGNKDAAFHVAMAFDIGYGVKQSQLLAKFWYKIFSSYP